MIAAFLQARMSSSRLPGKVLLPILGMPVILHQIARIRQAKAIDKLIVLTSDDPTDDILVKTLEEHNIDFFRGPLHNVLNRFYLASQHYQAKNIVRLTADCPLTDPIIIDEVIKLHLLEQNDYTSSISPRLLPDGLDVEVFTSALLEEANKYASSPYEKEHVTPYMLNHSSLRKNGINKNGEDYSKLRWTLDTWDDYQKIQQIYQHFFKFKQEFNFNEILEYEKTQRLI